MNNIYTLIAIAIYTKVLTWLFLQLWAPIIAIKWLPSLNMSQSSKCVQNFCSPRSMWNEYSCPLVWIMQLNLIFFILRHGSSLMLKNVNSDQVLCLVRCLSVWPVVLIGHVIKNIGRTTRISSHFDHLHIIITKGNHNHHDHFTSAGPICSTSEFSRWIPFPLFAMISSHHDHQHHIGLTLKVIIISLSIIIITTDRTFCLCTTHDACLCIGQD